MKNKSSMRMIEEKNNNSKKTEDECWNEKVEDYVASWFVNFKSSV